MAGLLNVKRIGLTVSNQGLDEDGDVYCRQNKDGAKNNGDSSS